jgi:hypothetical protein
MSGRDVALTGVPRGGTTLACRLLGQCELTVALFEPMPVLTLPCERAAAVEAVQAYYREVRAQIVREGTAPSQQQHGYVPDNPFAEPDPNGARPAQASAGLLRIDPAIGNSCTLAIKHNAAFTALLPELAQCMPTVAIVRNPLAVLASWQSVPLPVREGRVPAGERFDPALRRRLDDANAPLERQLIVLDWCFRQYAEHLPPERVIRYETMIASQGGALRHVLALRGQADAPLSERHPRRLCSAAALHALADALRSRDGAWRLWYDRDSIRQLAADA